MFIKDIVVGSIGVAVFPLAYLVINNIYFLTWGIITSVLLIMFYFVNVYVIGKRKTFLTIISSWIVILSLLMPFSFVFVGIPGIVLIYTGLISLSLSWMMVIVEMVASETFRGY